MKWALTLLREYHQALLAREYGRAMCVTGTWLIRYYSNATDGRTYNKLTAQFDLIRLAVADYEGYVD
jgi:hypothetical protein